MKASKSVVMMGLLIFVIIVDLATGFHMPLQLPVRGHPRGLVAIVAPSELKKTALKVSRLAKCSSSLSSENEPLPPERGRTLPILTSYAPLWTVVAAGAGLAKPTLIAPTIGALSTVEPVLAALMLAMGLVITPEELSRACRSPGVIVLNVLCCFSMMPLLGLLVAKTLACTVQQTVGIVLLGSVSGGQASNLFALLAGGDVALSVVCTLSTTLLGVLATPLLVKFLLGSSIVVDGAGVLRSVVSIVLVPLLAGLVLGRTQQAKHLKPYCPAIGVAATIVLVAGGAANSATALLGSGAWRTTALASLLLPILGGALALGLASFLNIPEASKRTLVVEVLSKSPTLAYVLAQKHFCAEAAAVPAAAMVSLAAIGATAASVWTRLSRNEQNS